MSDLYRHTFRGYLIDHHSPAPPIVTFDKLSIEEHERFYKEANISNLMLYMKDHWGYSYYNTKIGTRHPALDRDWIAEVVPVLRRLGIEFNAYYCLEYDTNTPLQHPDWAIVDAQGNPRRLKGRLAKWGLACYETGYRDYVLGQLREIVENYHPDSLFLDIFGKSLCYCNACRRKFEQSFGYPLPEEAKAVENEIATLDFGDKGRDINRFLEDCAADMMRDVLATVKGIDPTLKVTINFAALYPKRIRDMLDYQFTEPWAGNWLSAVYSRDTARGQFPQLGPGSVSEVYNFKHDDVYKLAAAQIAAGGCRVFMYSGSMHVSGALEHVEAQKVGAAFEEVKRFEQYLEGRETLADIAIIQSDLSSTARSGSDVVINAIGRCKKADCHREAVCGAMRVCDKLGYAWRVLPEQEATVEELSRHQCVILAGVYHISDALKAALLAFAEKGGRIIADGESGLYEANGDLRRDFALAELLGVSYNGRITQYQEAPWGGYIRQTDDPLWAYAPDTCLPVASAQIAVKAGAAKVVGELLHPSTELTDKTWVNWWCPPPKDEPSGHPAVTENNGHFYVAYEFFRMVFDASYLDLSMLEGMFARAIPTPSVRLETDVRGALSMVAYKRGDRYIVHELSHLAEKLKGAAPEIDGGKLFIGMPGIRRATLKYPREEALAIDAQGRVQLPRLSVHQLIELE